MAANPAWRQLKDAEKHIQEPWRRHHLSKDAGEAMLTAQGHKCASCNVDLVAEPTRRQYDLDHDHACCPGRKSCGKCVRAFLCRKCNLIVGAIESDRYEDAVRYLEKFRQKEAA
jgi:hypothetical protein